MLTLLPLKKNYYVFASDYEDAAAGIGSLPSGEATASEAGVGRRSASSELTSGSCALAACRVGLHGTIILMPLKDRRRTSYFSCNLFSSSSRHIDMTSLSIVT